MKRILLTGLIFIVVCATAHAQTVNVPQLINYQGKLTNAQGEPLTTADYSLEFNIYDSPTAGTVVWGPQLFDGTAGEGHGSKVPVVLGYFNVILGPNDTASRAVASAFSSGPNRYLGIKVNGGAEIQPRQQILSAPYAMAAGTAEVLYSPKNTDWGRIAFESESDDNSNLVFETGDDGNESFIFRVAPTVQLAKINSDGLVVSMGTVHSASGGFKFPDNTVQTTAGFPKPTGVVREVRMIFPGVWGTWRGYTYCPSGTYVCGAQVRFESSCGDCDDTAMNGIEFACCNF